jgi:hypothetical protein
MGKITEATHLWVKLIYTSAALVITVALLAWLLFPDIIYSDAGVQLSIFLLCIILGALGASIGLGILKKKMLTQI